MNLQQRIDLLSELGIYINSGNDEWMEVVQRANIHNPWFLPEFISVAAANIVEEYLDKEKLSNWAAQYHLDDNIQPKNVGIVMAGNIPMVGIHDLITVFLSGHKQTIKLSSKDNILMDHIVKKMHDLHPDAESLITVSEMLKGCDAYIATGSNNTGRYFEQYFSKYPNIIRKNKTSVAIITGDETIEELDALSDDIHLFFGLGCRNVTKLLVPENYDFIPLITSFSRYSYFRDHNKYSNNYDYQLSILLLNNIYYMTNGSTLLVENESIFSAISVVNYTFYKNADEAIKNTAGDDGLQCIVGRGYVPFGKGQKPSLNDYADGIDTMQFLLTL